MDFLIFFQYLSVMEWEVTAKKKSFFQHDVLGHGMTDLLAISWFFPFDGP
jgi:hypothetical protein